MHNRRTTTAILTVGMLCAALAGCSGSDGEVTYSAPPADPLPLGVTWEWTGTLADGAKATGTTTVLSYEQHEPAGAASANARYDQVNVQVCSESGAPVPVDRQFFGLRRQEGDVDGKSLPAVDPGTAYAPESVTLKPGECAQGTIEFPGAAGSRPLAAVWRPTGAAEAASWAIPR
ncbi:hypothetical protein OG625_12110 [Streptomyces sp. NBC_01351]|uniref:hypothetical protein n=1 Tax=Streptomyces sp. NBC_01351 TaxID=2903833 RepID=UPI002E30D5B7|nr:hypothetical protein [Streptomyces sp. NBC_01351]